MTRARTAVCCLFVAFIVTVTLADTPEPESTPAEPTLLVDQDEGTGEVVLSWTSTATLYSVVRGTDPNFFGGVSPTILATGLTALEHRDPVLTDDIIYFYSIEDANSPPKIYDVSPSPPLSEQALPGDPSPESLSGDPPGGSADDGGSRN